MTGLLSRWLLSRRWRESRLRSDAAALLLLVGSMLGHSPPHIDPLPTAVVSPLARGEEEPAEEVARRTAGG